MVDFEKLLQYVKDAFTQTDKAHDYWHSYRVYRNSEKIMKDYPQANHEVVITAALLHDTVDTKLFSGTEILDRWLEQSGSEYCSRIREVISETSFSAGKSASSIESMIVQDADRLDAIGAIGIARVFTYGGAIGRPIYAEEQISSVSHFDEKLFKLKANMNTETGRALANNRDSFMRVFLERLFAEIEGKE